MISIDHDPAFAERTRAALERVGLQQHAEVHVATLQHSALQGRDIVWYDRRALERILPARIDLLIVDGPPSTARRARWPAVELLGERLGERCVVLLDDGRRRDETATAMLWARRHPDLALFWHDTVKGTWRLERTPAVDGAVLRLARRGIGAVDAHPAGFRRWPVRR